MGIFSRLFGKKKSNDEAINNAQSRVEDFISLIGVYNQAFLMTHLGITNIRMFPDLMMYKQIMRIPTVGGRFGVGERVFVRKMIISEYNLDESFLKEIDSSIRRNCKKVNDMQKYSLQFGTFTNDILTHLYKEHQLKLTASVYFKKLLHSSVTSMVEKMMSNKSWSTTETNFAVAKIQSSAQSLGLSNKWMADFVFQVLILSKKKK